MAMSLLQWMWRGRLIFLFFVGVDGGAICWDRVKLGWKMIPGIAGIDALGFHRRDNVGKDRQM